MTQTISEHTGELVVLRCWCGIQLAVPESLRSEQLRKRDMGEELSVYCPLGHKFVPGGTSRVDRLERQLQRERAKHDQTRAELETTERRRRAEKGAKTRLANRVKAGVCPCCNHTFKNLARHMETKHPEFAPTTEAK